MPAEDLFKRYLEVGASVLGMSRERAESIVRDLVASGEVARGQATKAADWLVERGRTGTEELGEMIRREIRQQVAAMGLVTQDDLARLEARIEELGAAATHRAPAEGAGGPEPRATATPKAAMRTTAASGASAPEAGNGPEAPRKARSAAPRQSSGRGQAGITRSGSVKRAGGAPPAAEPAPPEG